MSAGSRHDGADAAARAAPALVGMELIPGDEADAVAESVVGERGEVNTRRLPAVLLVEAPGQLRIDSADVSERLGRAWSTDDLQAIMASYFGFITRWDDEGVVLEWSGNRGHEPDG